MSVSTIVSVRSSEWKQNQASTCYGQMLKFIRSQLSITVTQILRGYSSSVIDGPDWFVIWPESQGGYNLMPAPRNLAAWH